MSNYDFMNESDYWILLFSNNALTKISFGNRSMIEARIMLLYNHDDLQVL